ncbi:hypothetical protein GCM10007387_37160 [Pseudoduganella albidiflava]|uniref:Uncharacterized protein n=2 Tax=Pseudoduganella albidiflava TaxID=321983 RepID=A0AA87XZV2_9BURK|nr:hypothetical protein GCM10007387_37160 [Pseudoduganella albidiflava]
MQLMKALKSQLASEVLADPEGRKHLREFLTRGASDGAPPSEFLFRRPNGETVRLSPRIVPKAKAA